MPIDAIVLSSITGAISVLGTEYLKGIASESAKTTWAHVKTLLGWSSDPAPAEIPEKVAGALVDSPELVETVLKLLKSNDAGTASQLVGRLVVRDQGKVVIARDVGTLNMGG